MLGHGARESLDRLEARAHGAALPPGERPRRGRSRQVEDGVEGETPAIGAHGPKRRVEEAVQALALARGEGFGPAQPEVAAAAKEPGLLGALGAAYLIHGLREAL